MACFSGDSLCRHPRLDSYGDPEEPNPLGPLVDPHLSLYGDFLFPFTEPIYRGDPGSCLRWGDHDAHRLRHHAARA